MADHVAPVPAAHEVGIESAKATSAEAVKAASEAPLTSLQSHDAVLHVGEQKGETTVPATETTSTAAVDAIPVVPEVKAATTKAEDTATATVVPTPLKPKDHPTVSSSDVTKSAPEISPLPVVAEPVGAPETKSEEKTVTGPPAPTVEEAAPDPDEDDLDDLDDLLDEFSTTNISAPEHTAASATSGPGRPTISDPLDSLATDRSITEPAGGLAGAAAGPAAPGANPNFPAFPFDPLQPLPAEDDDFARQLQAGMADLLTEMENSPDMQRQFEEMMRELAQTGPEGSIPGVAGAAAGAAGAAGIARDVDAAGSLPQSGQPPLSFQESIQRTMERIQNSDTSSTSAAAASASTGQEADFMAALLKEMESGSGSDEDFSKMLLGMMEQLTNKEILYEPMKELNDKFPAWLESHKDQTGAEDLARYKEQQGLVGQIVAKFEEPGYTDEDIKSREFIVEKMQKMQSLGSPPSDLVGDMDAAQDALGGLDEGCPTQ